MSIYPQVPSSLSYLKFERIDYRNCYYYEDAKVSILKSYNTIVALFVKKTRIAFIDEYSYSGYTSGHISLFLQRFIKEVIDKYICISQAHLIDNILKALSDFDIKLDIQYRFNPGDYAKIYRLHGKSGKIVRIEKASNVYYYAFRVDKDYKERFLTYLTPLTPGKYGVKFDKVNCIHYVRLRNLRPIEGGI